MHKCVKVFSTKAGFWFTNEANLGYTTASLEDPFCTKQSLPEVAKFADMSPDVEDLGQISTSIKPHGT